MPPKRARVTPSMNEEEEEMNDEPSGSGPATAERKARAEEKKLAILANKRAILKEEKHHEMADPSPAKKKEKKDKDEDEEEEEKDGKKKFDPMKIVAQAGTRKLVDLVTPGFIPLELDSPLLESFNSDSFNSLSQLSPGLQLGNLSLRSSDSPNQALNAVHAAGEHADKEPNDDEDYSGGLDAVLGAACTILKSENKKGNLSRKKKEQSLNGPYRRGKTIMGNSMLTNVLSKMEDLALLERTYSAPELVLMSSPAYMLEIVYKKALYSIDKARTENDRAGVQETMSINQCLAWMACAGRCSITSLIPAGEYYPDAEDYLRARLIVPALPLLSTATMGLSIAEWTAHQVERCFKMMAMANVGPMIVDDKCILLFAIGMLYIDDGATDRMREAAHLAVANVLSSCDDPVVLLEPLFNLTPLIVRRPDEAYKWIDMFKQSGEASPELLLCLGASHFVFVCERAECTPDSFSLSTPSATYTSYISVMAETVIDVFAVYMMMSHRRYHRNLVTILNICLTPTVLRESEAESRKALLCGIEVVMDRLNPDLPDDSIVLTGLRTLTRRMEIKRTGRGERRTSEEIIRILEEKERMKAEREEERRGLKKEKRQLRKERQLKERSEGILVIDDEEEDEDEMEGDEDRSQRERMEEFEDEEEDEDEISEKGSRTDGEFTDGEMSERGMEEKMEKEKKEDKKEGGGGTLFTEEDFMDLDVGVSKEDNDLNETIADTVSDHHDISDEM